MDLNRQFAEVRGSVCLDFVCHVIFQTENNFLATGYVSMRMNCCFLFETANNGQQLETLSVMHHCESTVRVKYSKAYLVAVSVH